MVGSVRRFTGLLGRARDGRCVHRLGYFRERASGRWVLLLTNLFVEVGVFLVLDPYDIWRLWWFPHHILAIFDRLNLSWTLGRDGVAYVARYVQVIRSVYWSRVSADQHARSHCSATKYSPDRPAPAGDYVWLNL